MQKLANLLFWVIWAYLATHTKNDSINLKKPLFFICKQKINFILHLSLEILHGYCKLFIFGASGMPGYAHPKWYYQLVESFRIYLLDFSYLFIFFYLFFVFIHSPRFTGDIAKICKILILGTLGMSGYGHAKW